VDFEWDEAKSERNRAERGLPFELAVFLFDRPVTERIDRRRDYGEVRVRAIGMLGDRLVTCVYTDRGRTRRIISLRYSNGSERDAYRAAQSSRPRP
jgi:uncharacterized protein